MPRRWYFLLRNPIREEENVVWEERIREALQGWKAHGRPVMFEVDFPYHHYVAVTALSPVSGCAIDQLFRTLLPLLNPLPTHYLAIRKNEKVEIKMFYEIIKLKNEGLWQEGWRVIEVVGDELLERPIEESGLAVHL